MPGISAKQPTGTTSSTQTPFKFEAKEVPIEKLFLDPNNYRFFDFKKFKKKAANRFHEQSVQRAVLDSLERHYQLDELKESILANGFVPMERIIVTPYPKVSGAFLVVEGNRRVAALKSLINDAKDGTIELSASSKASFSKVPCVVLKAGGKSLKHAERVIMGIRHIAGPKQWGPYQQALLISELRDEEGQEFHEIGEALGISSSEAARRYRAITALKAMEADELFSKKAEPEFYKLFHEMVALPEVRARFGWSMEKSTFIDNEKAHEFFGLIASDGVHDPKVHSYSDVRKLKFIVGNSKAEDALFEPATPFADALKIGELGKGKADASSLLEEAKGSLAQISIVHAKSLAAKDYALIDEIIASLQALKSVTQGA